MPCYDTQAAEDRIRQSAEYQRLVDMMCRLGKAYIKGTKPDRDIMDWWRDHAIKDAQRGEPWK